MLAEVQAEIERLSLRRQKNWAEGVVSAEKLNERLRELFEMKRALIAKREAAYAD